MSLLRTFRTIHLCGGVKAIAITIATTRAVRKGRKMMYVRKPAMAVRASNTKSESCLSSLHELIGGGGGGVSGSTSAGFATTGSSDDSVSGDRLTSFSFHGFIYQPDDAGIFAWESNKRRQQLSIGARFTNLSTG